MKKNFLLAMLAAMFITWSCSDTKDKKSKDDDTEETGKKKKTGDDEPATDEEASDDANTPEAVVKIIFKAARSGDYSTLSGLCAEEADGDSKDICQLEKKTARQEEFKEYFSKGKVVGEAEIEGSNAKVQILFGPDGDKEETMNLVKEGKKWKLVSF